MLEPTVSKLAMTRMRICAHMCLTVFLLLQSFGVLANSSLGFDLIFPTAAVLHVWFELLVLLLMAGSGITFGVLAGLSDLQHLFRGLDHDKTFCLLGLLGVLIAYVGAILALITACFVWRVPRRIVQSSDGKKYWRRSIRQIYHNRYTGLPPDVIFADLGDSTKRESSKGGESWYQESAYALNTQQRTSWIPPDHGQAPPYVPPNPYSTPYDR